MEGKKNEDRSGKSDEDAVVNGQRNAKRKPISRKWKLRTRKIIAEEGANVGPINAKRPSSDGFWPNPKRKRMRKQSPAIHS